MVGHGKAWTLLVASLTDTKPDIEQWRALLMPDHCVLDGGAIVAASGSWGSR
jgi:hypothetical protein